MSETPPITRRKAIALGAAATLMAVDTATALGEESKPLLPPRPVVSPAEYKASQIQTQETGFAQLKKQARNYIIEEKFANIPEEKRTATLRKIGQQYKGLVDTVLSENNITLDPQVKKVILGMALIESEGDETTRGGLFQISSKALEEIAKTTPGLAGKNMQNPYYSTWAAAALLRLYTREGEAPLAAVWKFHVGEHRFNEAVNAYKQEQQTTDISLPTLIESPSVKNYFSQIYSEGNPLDGAIFYVPRAMVAAEMIDEALLAA